MRIKNAKVYKRQRRHLRIRQRVVGTPEKPRLCVFRSAKHIYAQIVDDVTGRTLVAASSLKIAPLSAEPAVEKTGEEKETKGKAKDKKAEKSKGKKEEKGKKSWTGGRKTAAAREVGRLIAEAAKAKGINAVCFDRGGYLFHGRIAALAETARRNGLNF
jgi:large subunit ribosomal protein L18